MPVPEHVLAQVDALLAEADAALARDYPGDGGGRQPVHTLYVPADRFDGEALASWGPAAQQVWHAHLDGAADLAGLLDVPVEVAERVLPRVEAKLGTEPVEDVRIDLEDGFGVRADDVEDAAARSAASALAAAVAAGTAPPFSGVRFKSLEATTRRRGLRTLDLVVDTLAAAGGLPEGFGLTLPKVTSAEQVTAMVRICEHLEAQYGLASGRLRFEVQVETPQAVLGADGTATVARMIHAGGGRVSGLHYGTYDYSASVGVAAAWQSLEHPAADHAKAVLQVAAAGTGVRLSDGSTNVLPVGTADEVRAAWRLHARLVRRSLERGFYQGWDLHPAHLPTRYAATYAFYLSGIDPAAARLRRYLDRQDGGILDEPATAAALAGYLWRAVQCGAADAAAVCAAAGLPADDLAALATRRTLVHRG